jgi:hypothetical protein
MDTSALASAESWLSTIAIAKLVAAFLVAAGVVIEFGSDWVARPFEATVKHAREVEVKALQIDLEAAKADAARANERAADIEKITAWRIIEPTTKELLKEALLEVPESVPHSVVFAYPPNDMESLYFTAQIASAFMDLKIWNLERQSRTYAGQIYWGIHILAPDNATTRAIEAAFTKAHIDFATNDIPGGFQTYGYMLKPDDTVILVGPKKPPMAP